MRNIHPRPCGVSYERGTLLEFIDPGVSTIAAVSDDKLLLRELAPGATVYDSEIKALARKMERSRRLSNPDRFNEDGTIKKGHKGKWKLSNTYFKDKRKLKTLYRKRSAIIKQSHEKLSNEIVSIADCVYIEKMSFKALQRSSKKTERQEASTVIETKTGDSKAIHKYKRKKRFGHSLNTRAPATLLSVLKRKCELYDIPYIEIDTTHFKASQYDHVTDTYTKTPLTQRSKSIGGHEVQRDLYSAFLIKNTDSTLEHPDRDRCNKEFDSFIALHDRLIADMKSQHISMKQCFGF